jgi:hypothetical protein
MADTLAVLFTLVFFTIGAALLNGEFSKSDPSQTARIIGAPPFSLSG